MESMFYDPQFSEYKSIEYKFPNSDIDPAQKNEKVYCARTAQAIYSVYLRNKSAIPYAIRPYQELLRAFGRGQQPENRYKSFLLGDETPNLGTSAAPVTDVDGSWTALRETRRKGWLNMAWDIVSPIPKIKAALKGIFDNYEYDVTCDTIDEASGAEKEDQKWLTFTQMKNDQFLMNYKLKAGIPIDQDSFVPESIEELEMYEAAGGFKLNYAMLMEKLIHFSFEVSNWSEVKEKIIDDLFDFGMAACRTYYDVEDCLVKARYVDMSHMIIQYSQAFNYNDSEYAAELTLWTISKLRTLGYDESELKAVAKRYVNLFGNANFTDWDRNTFVNPDGSHQYDDFKILVCEAEWIDMDKVFETINTDKRGNVTVFDQTWGKYRDTERNKTRVTKIRRKYQCNWIVGSNMAFGFGIVKNQPYPRTLSFHVFEIPGLSLTKRLIPIADNIQIGWLKYQNALSQVFEAGYMLDLDMLNNLTKGGATDNMLAALSFWRGTSVLPFRGNKLGHTYQGGAVTPMQIIPSVLLTKIEEANAMIKYAMDQLEVVTGLNPLVLGGQPAPESAVGNNQLAITNSQNVLRPLILANLKIKEKASTQMSQMITLAIRNDKKAYRNYSAIIGESNIELLKTGEDNGVKYGIFMIAKPTPDQKTSVVNAANISLGQHRDGKPGITLDQYMFIIRLMEEGTNLKQVEMRLGYMIKKAYEKDMYEKQALMQQQIEGNAQNKKIEVDGEAQKQQFLANSQMAIDNNKSHNEAALIILKHQADQNTAPPIGSPVTSPLNIQPNPQQPESPGVGGMGQEEQPPMQPQNQPQIGQPVGQ